jgi:hypothetical protein
MRRGAHATPSWNILYKQIKETELEVVARRQIKNCAEQANIDAIKWSECVEFGMRPHADSMSPPNGLLQETV